MCLKCPPYVLKHNYTLNEKFCDLCGTASKSSGFAKCHFDGCKNTFHQSCINKIKTRIHGTRHTFHFPRSWQCSCHSCLLCGSLENLNQCYRCMTTYCQKHETHNIFRTPDNRLACELHYSTFFAKQWSEKSMTLSDMAVLQIALEYWKNYVDKLFIKHVKEHRLNELTLKVLRAEIKFLRNNLFLQMEFRKRIFIDIHEIGNVLREFLSIHNDSNKEMKRNWYSARIINQLVYPDDETDKIVRILAKLRQLRLQK